MGCVPEPRQLVDGYVEDIGQGYAAGEFSKRIRFF